MPTPGPSARFAQDLRFTRAADGTRLAFAAHGHGPPLVRAAHWLTNIDVDWQTPMWRPWFDAIGRRFRFYRYDSRGCGLSDRDATDASLDVLVGDLEAVVDAAKLDKFALLGTSQGGAVSIAYAVRHPERGQPPRAARGLRAWPAAPQSDRRRGAPASKPRSR